MVTDNNINKETAAQQTQSQLLIEILLNMQQINLMQTGATSDFPVLLTVLTDMSVDAHNLGANGDDQELVNAALQVVAAYENESNDAGAVQRYAIERFNTTLTQNYTLEGILGLDMSSMHAHAYPYMIKTIESTLKQAGYEDPIASLKEHPELMAAAKSYMMYAGADNIGFNPDDKLSEDINSIQKIGRLDTTLTQNYTLEGILGLDMSSMHAHAYPYMIETIENTLKQAGYEDPIASLKEHPELMAAAKSYMMYAGADNIGFNPDDKLSEDINSIQQSVESTIPINNDMITIEVVKTSRSTYDLTIGDETITAHAFGPNSILNVLENHGIGPEYGKLAMTAQEGSPVSWSMPDPETAGIYVEYSDPAKQTINVAWDVDPISITIPNGVEPPESYLSEGFQEIVIAEGASIRDGREAPIEPKVEHPAEPSQDQDIQMAINTTDPRFNIGSFA